ncbi:hypothetical protein FQA47_004643 [Oryzias melastigma]|uniref:Uncharacterized protein n=1 Tax=Oryzias melastigma TaxID=30732 RepID=A0A834BUS0_ORYME|nr:hypothetical protein FQA47_004643 [Oryzias melastigma]
MTYETQFRFPLSDWINGRLRSNGPENVVRASPKKLPPQLVVKKTQELKASRRNYPLFKEVTSKATFTLELVWLVVCV